MIDTPIFSSIYSGVAYVTKNASVATFCSSGFLYTKMFVIMCRFQKWFLPFFLFTFKVKVKGQRSRL